MAKKAIRAKKVDSTIDRTLGIKIRNRTYYPLPQRMNTSGMEAPGSGLVVAMELNPCAAVADNKPCPSIPGCVCRGGQCFYTLAQLQKMGFAVAK
jgi:hypothetical protein